MSVESTLRHFIESLTKEEIIVKILANDETYRPESLLQMSIFNLENLLLKLLLEKNKKMQLEALEEASRKIKDE
jgi:hypothetical protein